jgi:hypothetical protein
MAVGKYLSLEEARKLKKLERFAKEHPSEGDADQFEDLLKAMADGNSRPPKRKGGSDD